MEKSGQLVQELEKYRDEALRLDRLNEQVRAVHMTLLSSEPLSKHYSMSNCLIAPQLSNENQRLKTHAKCQEDDREFLVRQIVALKKENARLHKDVEKAALSSLKSSLNTAAQPAVAAAAADVGAGESIAKYTPLCCCECRERCE